MAVTGDETLTATASDLSVGHRQNPDASPFYLGGACDSKQPPDAVVHKKQIRLMKNREAAKECRRKKKEYLTCLENRVVVLESQNKCLMDELRALKQLYRLQ